MSIDREVNIEKALVGLVAPLELCNKIPDGAFADSALVWLNRSLGWFVEERHEGYDIIFETYPAPTLAEIMSALPKCVEYRWFDDGFYPSHPKHYAGDFADPSPTTAVLKLWLTLNAGEVKK